MKPFATLLCLAVSGSSCSEPDHPDAGDKAQASRESQGDRAGIIGGDIAGADDYPSVVALRIGGPENLLCSAVLVDSRVALTAAHCVSEHEQWWLAEPELLTLVEGTDVDRTDATHELDVVCNHSAYNKSSGDNDIGRLRLATESVATPAAINTTPMSDEWLGRTVTLVGFGPDLGKPGPGVRRYGTATITEVEASTFIATPSSGQACHGDSGGAVFYESDLGPVLVGLISRGPRDCDGYTRAVRSDRHLEFSYSSRTESVGDQVCSDARLSRRGSITSGCQLGATANSDHRGIVILILLLLLARCQRARRGETG